MCEKKDVYIWLKTEDEGEDKYQSFLNGFGDYMMDLYITRLVLMLGGSYNNTSVSCHCGRRQ